jgi:hypothetical protein
MGYRDNVHRNSLNSANNLPIIAIARELGYTWELKVINDSPQSLTEAIVNLLRGPVSEDFKL